MTLGRGDWMAASRASLLGLLTLVNVFGGLGCVLDWSRESRDAGLSSDAGQTRDADNSTAGMDAGASDASEPSDASSVYSDASSVPEDAEASLKCPAHAQTACGASCINLTDDPGNCGRCGRSCKSG